MKKILTLAVIAIFAANFASASTLTTGMGSGKLAICNMVKTAHSKKYTKIAAKDFSIKNMQDTKDILMQLGIQVAVNNNGTTTTLVAAR